MRLLSLKCSPVTEERCEGQRASTTSLNGADVLCNVGRSVRTVAVSGGCFGGGGTNYSRCAQTQEGSRSIEGLPSGPCLSRRRIGCAQEPEFGSLGASQVEIGGEFHVTGGLIVECSTRPRRAEASMTAASCVGKQTSPSVSAHGEDEVGIALEKGHCASGSSCMFNVEHTCEVAVPLSGHASLDDEGVSRHNGGISPPCPVGCRAC